MKNNDMDSVRKVIHWIGCVVCVVGVIVFVVGGEEMTLPAFFVAAVGLLAWIFTKNFWFKD